MKRRIEFSDSARVQFVSAVRYIQKDDPTAARSFRVKAERSLVRLIDFPDSGRSIPEFPELSYREIIVPPYRLFYTVMDDRVLVVGVWHSAQIPNPPV